MLPLLACNPPTQDPTPPAPEWLDGEWFLGSYGNERAVDGEIKWIRFEDDGTWVSGSRSCSGEDELFSGQWEERTPGAVWIEPVPFEGEQGEQAWLTYEGSCPDDTIEFIEEGRPSSYTQKPLSKGRACLDLCDQPEQGYTVVVDCNDADPCG
ncbi:MAG: hypothetical protein AAFU79_29280 [Myxococcota bacterium]